MASTTLGYVTEEPVSEAEGVAIVDHLARLRLGISGGEFMARWESGDCGTLDHVAVMEVAALIPLAR